MRVSVDLDQPDAESLPLSEGGRLWQARLCWPTAGADLDLRVVAAEVLDLPAPVAGEPVEGAIARVAEAVRGSGALLYLANPAACLGPERIRSADGIRLMAVHAPANRACWDAALSVLLPIYGVAGPCVCEVTRAAPAPVLSALAYGGFITGDLVPEGLVEDRGGVSWSFAEDTAVEVVVRDGFVAARFDGLSGRWDDRGSEGSVRLECRGKSGSCLTQPRFIAPRR